MNNTFFPHEHCCWQGSYLPFCIGPAGSPFFLLCLHHLVACLQQQVQAQSIPHDRFYEEKQPWVTERLFCASLLCPCLSGSMWPVPLPWPVCSTLILSAAISPRPWGTPVLGLWLGRRLGPGSPLPVLKLTIPFLVSPQSGLLHTNHFSGLYQRSDT